MQGRGGQLPSGLRNRIGHKARSWRTTPHGGLGYALGRGRCDGLGRRKACGGPIAAYPALDSPQSGDRGRFRPGGLERVELVLSWLSYAVMKWSWARDLHPQHPVYKAGVPLDELPQREVERDTGVAPVYSAWKAGTSAARPVPQGVWRSVACANPDHQRCTTRPGSNDAPPSGAHGGIRTRFLSDTNRAFSCMNFVGMWFLHAVTVCGHRRSYARLLSVQEVEPRPRLALGVSRLRGGRCTTIALGARWSG